MHTVLPCDPFDNVPAPFVTLGAESACVCVAGTAGVGVGSGNVGAVWVVVTGFVDNVVVVDVV